MLSKYENKRKYFNFDITNIYRNVNTPIRAFVVFQTNRNKNKKINFFDHVNFKNLWIELGGKHYPEEAVNQNFDSNYNCSAYRAFQNLRKIFIETYSIPYIDKNNFEKLNSIYSIDLSHQPEDMSHVKIILCLMSTLTIIFQQTQKLYAISL